MHIENINITLNGGPSAITRAFIEAMMRGPELNEDGDQPATAAPGSVATNPVANMPNIGDQWPEQGGIYAGIARGLDGEPDGHLVLLPNEPTDKLNWTAANDWAKRVGNDSRLPTRFESALLYANLQDKIDTDGWYWTGTQSSDGTAFNQDFHYGNQGSSTKKSEGRARAVRRLAI